MFIQWGRYETKNFSERRKSYRNHRKYTQNILEVKLWYGPSTKYLDLAACILFIENKLDITNVVVRKER